MSVALTVLVFTIAACFWLAEHVFFDKFFFQKSLAHGYWVTEESSYEHLAAYGNRGTDILGLLHSIHDENATVLGAADSDEFTIALYGDSYTWGAGVREHQRYAAQLEQELDRSRPTKVLVFAMEGDNVVDQYLKYQAVQRSGQHIDVHIFGIVHNDALLKKNYVYGELPGEVSSCSGETVWDISEDWQDIDAEKEYPIRIQRSFSPDTLNACIVDRLLQTLPKEKSLYVGLDSLLSEHLNDKLMLTEYKKRGFTVLEFSPLSKEHPEVQEKLFVSQKERHPSALAHRLYAEQIAKVLREDNRFGFRQQN